MDMTMGTLGSNATILSLTDLAMSMQARLPAFSKDLNAFEMFVLYLPTTSSKD
jgi:hypothetical protein